MNQGKYIFAQIVELLPQRIFDRFVEKYDGNKYVKHFSCWNQLLCMLFSQLTNRDLIIALDAHRCKSYHPGFGRSVTRSNLAKANEAETAKYLRRLLIILSRLPVKKEPTMILRLKAKSMLRLIYH